ncbi:helix-turn-helix transcriptional regulator [Paenibacillus sp. WQ 127069]|uniref:Helix-turn-helix transcriptional regulator n=1 Tax=Paenibacillus baimaensis TaxID=2982185 RepID=A0ABT2UTR2_9BACL|nr:helix-turn-helix transcriptional regulator [Paenibacillus sp. WQ 127069]MCU6798032.1 helix-turn-helix transcriptional regulator [Paenibacillus sp. WQ 127069]
MERNWLVEIRNIKEYTQEQVADLCEIKRPYYTMIETGKRRPSVDVAKKIAIVLGFEWIIFFAIDSNDSLHENEHSAG